MLALSPLIAATAEPPSPPLQATDWRDQILYVVMLDRFDDGDPGNDDQGAGEYDPGNGRRFSDGDLAGDPKQQGVLKVAAAAGKPDFHLFGEGFDTAAPLYRYLQRITALRRAHRLFSRGTPAVLAANAATPGGAIAWRMDGGTNEHALNEQALAVFNTAPHASLLDNLDIGLPTGTRLEPLFARLVERAVLRDRRRGSTWTAMRIP